MLRAIQTGNSCPTGGVGRCFRESHKKRWGEQYVGNYVQDDGGLELSFTSFTSDYSLLASLSVLPPVSSDSAPYTTAEDDEMLDPNEIAMAQSLRSQGYALPGTGIVVNNLTLRAVEGQISNPGIELPTSDQPEPNYNPATRCSETFNGNEGEYKYTIGYTQHGTTGTFTSNATWVARRDGLTAASRSLGRTNTPAVSKT